MKIVPQSDTSGDITVPTSPDVKQNTLRNEEEGENNPSPNEAVVVVQRLLSCQSLHNGAMKVPQRSRLMKVKLKNDTEVVCGYMNELMSIKTVPATNPVCDTALSDLTVGA
jgi:hypothetical protein